MARSRSRSRRSPIAMSGGGGFIYPTFSLSFTGSGFAQGSDQGAIAGSLTVVPSDSHLSLLDSDGNKFQLSGTDVQAGPVLTSPTDSDHQNITVRQLWAGRIVDIVVTIPLLPQTISLSGSRTFAHDIALDSVIGALTSAPTGASFAILSQDTPSGFKIVGTNLEKDSGVLSAGAYALTVRATKGSQHWDQAFAFTLT